jgi:hypothetical protein
MTRRELEKTARHVYRAAGDAVAGEQVIAQARQVGRAYVVPGTSSHRISQLVLRSNVICVLDQPFRLTERALRLAQPT